MPITLIVEPKTPPMSWENFCQKEKFSIALDGYVADGPKFNSTGPHLNFNHHEAVSRLETRATCAQVLMAIRQGLFRRFRDANGPHATIYVNDCDEDVCTSWYLLNNSYISSQIIDPLLNRLVFMEDMLDATAGAYPFPPDLPSLKEMAWIFQPYRQFRTWGLDRKNADEYRGIITDVEHRIKMYLAGNAKQISLDTEYQRVGGGKDWALIQEVGAYAKTGAYADGIQAYISFRERPNHRWTYTVGRMSILIPFEVPKILQHLNSLEGLENSPDRWGGGDTIGGSPRVAGSKLSPLELQKAINSLLEKS